MDISVSTPTIFYNITNLDWKHCGQILSYKRRDGEKDNLKNLSQLKRQKMRTLKFIQVFLFFIVIFFLNGQIDFIEFHELFKPE